MDAVMMAAGKGTRMGTITRAMPKPPIPVLGVPIIERTLDLLCGCTDRIIIVIDYLGDQIRANMGDSYKGIPIIYVQQQNDIPGTAGAVWSAQSSVRSDPFLVISGDDI